MKYRKSVLILLITLLMIAPINASSAPTEMQTKLTKLTSITTSDFTKVQLVKTELINNTYIHLQFKFYDSEPLPITVDLLQNVYKQPTKTMYMLPGSALNFETNFLTPKSNNLAIFTANDNYFIVGITPREDSAPSDFDYSLMKDWGLQFHTDDVKKIINTFQTVQALQALIPVNYEVLGHSAGDMYALNYASQTIDTHLKALRIIDTAGQYPPDSQDFVNAQISKTAADEVISQGTFVDNSFTQFKLLGLAAQADPMGDSGVPRYPYPGNFTYEGLVFFSLIHTNELPDTLTPITGLPGDWYLNQGLLAGTYVFNENPLNDTYSLTHTDISTIYSALNNVNSGVFPLATQRDFYALRSNQYPLNWSNISVPITWINTELGFGDVSYSISLLTNSKVKYSVVPDYAHADPVYSRTAQNDFWNLLSS